MLAEEPRITSLHSYRATDLLSDELAQHPCGRRSALVVGSATATKRAVDLGCYFLLNAAMFRHLAMLRHIAQDRLLTETDHTFGDRSSPAPRHPGGFLPMEHANARLHGLQPEVVRRLMWANLGTPGQSHWLLASAEPTYLVLHHRGFVIAKR